jgi:ankyrin repeat protein
MHRTLKALLLAVAVAASTLGWAHAQRRAPKADAVKPPFDQSAASRAQVTGTGTNPQADAAEAARAGRFGLIVSGRRGSDSTPGVICFTPRRSPPERAATFERGDMIGPREMAQEAYASAYNRTLVSQSNYRDADLCRLITPAEAAQDPQTPLIDRPARKVGGAPRDLYDAARRGGARDVAVFLKTTPINALDGVKMTALSWAVARDNKPAIDVLQRAGADPLAGDYGERGRGALYWAAALGRAPTFERLLRGLTPDLEKKYFGPDRIWPAHYIAAAVQSNTPAMVQAIQALPHRPLELWTLGGKLRGPAVLELALRDHPPGLANDVLAKALDPGGGRLDLVRLALAQGADPNKLVSYETPLSLAARGFAPDSPQAVDLLLKAGADPNLMAHRRRPVWAAVATMKLDARHDETDDRALAIFHRLRAAGADLNLPDWQGRPPAWTLLFPFTFDHGKLDASFVTPSLLELLVSNGLNLNTKSEGKRLLAVVEAQAGRDSELATTLRRLGAR